MPSCGQFAGEPWHKKRPGDPMQRKLRASIVLNPRAKMLIKGAILSCVGKIPANARVSGKVFYVQEGFLENRKTLWPK
ncbi:hypothetical protein CH380_12615 [Leptospira adleri]|uniref:Uncharacterized protein n=1 Tax=Leptospira adleri TaxID=2023186 RepID=A0A2M9YN17_9LEPT|nr:hypothetical protein CH380_12615 [Leptospira adleri]PJZ62531.1 hypothetical protein CH376_07780 [Leptospira adleri]